MQQNISAARQEDASKVLLDQAEEDARHTNRVPGYQGYVPSIKSENVFGDTFGGATRKQKEGKIKAGFDCDNGERYQSVAQGVYTD